MNVIDFGTTKDKIAGTENAKNEKRREIRELYESLTNNQEFLDILMIQIGKDIEEKFPGVKFRLISRIKTEKSYTDKLENDLAGLVDKRKIEDIKIYDIIALSIIIEHVPDGIKSNDPSFDSHISELIKIRNDTKLNLESHNAQITQYRKRIDVVKAKKQEKLEWQVENDRRIKEANKLKEDVLGIKEYLNRISKELENSIADRNAQLTYLQEDIESMEKIINRTKERYEKEDNECNHAFADYITRNLSKLDNVKTLGVTEIPKRLKQKENYDGYRAVHNCFEAQIQVKDNDNQNRDFHFICEVQGKSIDAFYVADRGKAARYHTNQKQEPGKIVKEKRVPNILNVSTPEELEDLREEIKRTVPRFRIYRHTISKNGQKQSSPEIYKLSMKECFMLYYYNQLFGNNELSIEPQTEELEELVKGAKLEEEDFKVYRNYEYIDRDKI